MSLSSDYGRPLCVQQLKQAVVARSTNTNESLCSGGHSMPMRMCRAALLSCGISNLPSGDTHEACERW